MKKIKTKTPRRTLMIKNYLKRKIGIILRILNNPEARLLNFRISEQDHV